MTQLFKSCRSALPSIIGKIKTVCERLRTWSAVSRNASVYAGFASDGTRFTIQWSRSEIVRSDGPVHGAESEDRLRYLCVCPAMKRPVVSAADDNALGADEADGVD